MGRTERRRARRDYLARGQTGLVAIEDEDDMMSTFFKEMDDEAAAASLTVVGAGGRQLGWPTTYREYIEHSSKAPPTTGGGLFTTTGSACSHVQDKFQVGAYQMLITAGHDVWDSELDRMEMTASTRVKAKKLETPDFGVYLASDWRAKMKLSRPRPVWPLIEMFGALPEASKIADAAAESKRLAEEAANAPDQYRWPHMLVVWPDQGVIDLTAAAVLVEWTLAQLNEGKVIDVGCAGAHGRTGTFLAMLLIRAEKLTPEQAITEVRRRHCNRAIESETQVRAIFRFAGRSASEEEVKRLK